MFNQWRNDPKLMLAAPTINNREANQQTECGQKMKSVNVRIGHSR